MRPFDRFLSAIPLIGGFLFLDGVFYARTPSDIMLLGLIFGAITSVLLLMAFGYQSPKSAYVKNGEKMSETSLVKNPVDELPDQMKEKLYLGEEVVQYLKTFEIVERPNFIILTNFRTIYFDEKRFGRYDFISIPFQKILQMDADRGVVWWGDISFRTEDDAVILLENVNHDDMKGFIDAFEIAYNRIAVEPISIKHNKSLLGKETWVFNKPKEMVFRQQPFNQAKPSENPLEQLKMRFIRGEISEEEYKGKLCVLQEG